MAELLVKNRDDGEHKRGYVVEIMPDGWGWGDGETGGGEFVIVKAPGVDPASLTAFTAAELGHGEDNRILGMRGFSLDLDGVKGKQTLKQLIARQQRVVPRFKD